MHEGGSSPADTRPKLRSRPGEHTPEEGSHGKTLDDRGHNQTTLFVSVASILVRDQQRAMTGDQSEPHNPTVPRAARRLCGRWLIVQCLRLGFTLDELAAQARIDAEMLKLITLGLADMCPLDDDCWSLLASQLADECADADIVRAVLGVALGDPGISVEVVLKRVEEDLRLITLEE